MCRHSLWQHLKKIYILQQKRLQFGLLLHWPWFRHILLNSCRTPLPINYMCRSRLLVPNIVSPSFTMRQTLHSQQSIVRMSVLEKPPWMGEVHGIWRCRSLPASCKRGCLRPGPRLPCPLSAKEDEKPCSCSSPTFTSVITNDNLRVRNRPRNKNKKTDFLKVFTKECVDIWQKIPHGSFSVNGSLLGHVFSSHATLVRNRKHDVHIGVFLFAQKQNRTFISQNRVWRRLCSCSAHKTRGKKFFLRFGITCVGSIKDTYSPRLSCTPLHNFFSAPPMDKMSDKPTMHAWSTFVIA